MVVKGLATQDIAEQVGVTQASVRRHIRLGLAKLTEGSSAGAHCRARASRAVMDAPLERSEGKLRLSEEVARAARHGRPLSVLAVRMRSASDPEIEQLGVLLCRLTRKADLVIRWSVQVFVVVLPGARLQQAQGVLRRIKGPNGHHLSTGAAQVRRGERVPSLLRRLSANQ